MKISLEDIRKLKIFKIQKYVLKSVIFAVILYQFYEITYEYLLFPFDVKLNILNEN